jgi:hypothetical protein
MSRVIALPLQALVALAATVGAQSGHEPLGAHLASPGALRCARSHGAADVVVDVQTRRGGGSVRRTQSSPGSIRPAAAQATVAEAGWRGVHFQSPSLALARLAITLSTRIARLRGARPAVATTAESAPKPPTAGNGNVNAGGLPRAFGLGRLGRSGDIRPHWRGRPWGFASRRPFSGDSLGTSWGHPGRVARNVRFPDKWDNALLAIAKGVMP